MLLLMTLKNYKVSMKFLEKFIFLNLSFLAIRQREADITKERVEKILASGANVILTTGGIDDLNTKYFVDAKAMGVRRVLKKDLKRIAKATGGKNHKIMKSETSPDFLLTYLRVSMTTSLSIIFRV